MKTKLLSLFMALIATTAIGAETIEVNGINYLIAGDSAAVTCKAKGGYSGIITIPSTFSYQSKTYRVVRIGSSAFEDCTSLKSVTIPNGVTKIDHYAFRSCTSLTSITIPNSVSSIDGNVFIYCSSLAAINVDSQNKHYSSVNGVLFNYAQDTLLCYPGGHPYSTYTIPNSVICIDAVAFCMCKNLSSITIPSNVASILSGAFLGCSGLKSVDVQGLTTKFNETISPEDLEVLIKNYGLLYVEYYFFVGLPNVENISAPASFFNVPEVGWSVCCSSLQHVKITTGNLTQNVLKVLNRSYKNLKILDVSAATNTTLADEAFMGCYNLDTLLLPSQLEHIPYMAVAGCKNLKTIDIPSSVIDIEQSAFEDCRSLTSITFGGAAQSPARMKADATSALKKIGNWAFYNAHQLQNLTIPEGVEEIGDGAFYGCTYLQDLVLPSTTKEIGDNCFALCSKMKKITVTSMTPPTIYAKTFYDVNRSIPVYVPDEAVDNYKNDTYWKEFDIRGGATGLDQLSNSPVNRFTKVIKDGKLYILRDGKTYNAQGAEVK